MDKDDVIYICVYIYIYTHIYIIEYHTAIKKTLLFATTEMDLESIMLSEYVKQRKTNMLWLHLYTESKKTKRTNKRDS